ncbi:unnamed protein product [Chironomus riparius]|uniref:Uncharacterized protein n=1 Tax=Chironomus riparius TaxID=315576 RepID=A0A9N9S6B0_9DIPT|nr:unnamed protein product [Chironomus riparius]
MDFPHVFELFHRFSTFIKISTEFLNIGTLKAATEIKMIDLRHR